MQDYHFYIDQKITCWERLNYSVQASTEEEAIKIAKTEFTTLSYDNLYDCEKIGDTEELILPENNNDVATRELYLEGNLILDNGTL